MTMNRILSFLLPVLLSLTVVFNGCKPKTDDPAVTPATQPDSILFYTLLYKLDGQQTSTKAVVILDYREDLLKSKVKQAALSGKLIQFKQADFLAIDLALKTVAGVLRKKGPELNAYATITDYYLGELKKVPGYEPVTQLTETQIKSFIGQKEVLAFTGKQPNGSDVQTAGFASFVDALLAWLNPFAPGINAAGNTFTLRNFAGYVGTTFGYTGAISTGAASAIPLVGGVTLATPSMTTSMASFAYSTGDPVVGNAVDELGSRGPLDWLADHFGGNSSGDSIRDFFGLGGGGSTPTPSGGGSVESFEDYVARTQGTGGTQGEPIIAGLDGARKLLHPAGELWAIRAKNDAFAVQVRFEPVPVSNGLPYASTTTALAIRTGKDVVSFAVKPLKIYVNGAEINPEFSETQLLQDRAFITRPAPNKYSVTTTFGDLIEVRVVPTYNISWYVRNLNEKRRNQVEGLLGQYNGNPDDDFMDKSGTIYTTTTPRKDWYGTYANDWRINQAESILVYPAGKNTESYTQRDFPQKVVAVSEFELAARNQAEQDCRKAGISVQPDLTMCMFDVLATGRPEMADQQALAIRLKSEKAVLFGRQSEFPGKSGDGAIALAVGNRIFAGLGTGQPDWYEYNPTADTWTKRADFAGSAKGIYGMAPFVIGQKIYVAGGVNATDFKVVTWLWEYDVATDKWTKRKDLPGAARANMAGFAVGGKGYVVFGSNGGGSSEADYPERSATYQYDPTTDNWTKQANYPGVPRGANFTNKEYNGVVLTIGGRPFVGGGTGSGFRDWYEYKPATNAWEKRADSPASIGFFQAAVGNVGYLFTPGSKSYLQYNAATNTWAEQTDFYFPGSAATGTRQTAVVDGRAYFGLGRDTEQWWRFVP